MWLWLSLTALLCWSGSDLFSKIGCRDGSDRYSHLKMVIAVGVVMGLHAAFEIFVGGTAISWSVIWTYLPVSLLYISSMALGYLGLRYIELSVSSPICNSSGALVAVLTLLFVGGEDYSPLALLAIALVCTGAYLGLFNGTICIPQIVAAICGGTVLSLVGSHQSDMMIVAGILLILGALSVSIIKDKK